MKKQAWAELFIISLYTLVCHPKKVKIRAYPYANYYVSTRFEFVLVSLSLDTKF